MADTATQDPPQDTTPVGALVGGSDSGIGGLVADKSLVSGLTDVQRRRTAADEAALSRGDRQNEADRAMIQRAFNAEGHGPDELKPWDANKEHEKYETNPLDGFASPGALFAMVASAFTKAPMQNAIEGMAGALNGIKSRNDADYERAYDSWKENMKLAEKRHQMQHEAYTDALSLADHDVAASNAKLRENAVRFGDQQVLFLLEHGMNKELYELLDARNKSMTQAVAASDALQERGLRQEVFRKQWEDLPKTGNKAIDAAHKLALFNRIYGDKQTPQQELMGQFFADHPTATAEEAAKFADEHGIIRLYGTGGTGGAALTNDRVINRDAEVHKQQMQKDHPDWTEDQLNADRDAYVRMRKEASTAPTSTRVDDLRSKIDQADNIITESDKQIDFLEHYKGGAGLLGKMMRGVELAGNIGGTTETDRKQFYRRVLELQEMVPRILTDSNGRPLKSAQDKIDGLVAGLAAGDTSANTLRAYKDLVEEIKKRQQDYRGRIESGYQPGQKSSGSGKADPKPAAQDDSWYKSAPLVQ